MLFIVTVAGTGSVRVMKSNITARAPFDVTRPSYQDGGAGFVES